jgi:hypothetical protein
MERPTIDELSANGEGVYPMAPTGVARGSGVTVNRM